jgi:methylase of polypeptide subunit release factors
MTLDELRSRAVALLLENASRLGLDARDGSNIQVLQQQAFPMVRGSQRSAAT